MTIEYALTRSEIVTGYFRSLLASPRFLATILAYALLLSGIVLTSTGAFSRSFSLTDAANAALVALGFVLLLPALLFIRAKTSLRTLTISPEGISTRIGLRNGQLLWKKVKVIKETASFILVSGTGGNAFFIPERAFSEPEDKSKFVAQMRSWASQSAAH